jgi:hypothetical protein
MLNGCDNRLATWAAFWKRRQALYRISTRSSREIGPLVGFGRLRRAALLAPEPSAIMRRHTRLADSCAIGALVAACALVPGPDPCGAFQEPTAPPGDVDSLEAGTWLPVPEEDLESTEALEEEPGTHTGAILRGSVTRGRLRPRRIGLLGERCGVRGEIGILVDGLRWQPGVRFAAGDRVELAGGRISVTRAPPLLAEAMGISRPGRRVTAPQSGSIAASPSLGASAGAIDGGSVALRRSGAWAFAGARGASRQPVGGFGIGVRRGGTRGSAAIGAAGPASRSGSVTVQRRDPGRKIAVEALGGTAGKALLAEIAARGRTAYVSARWRYRSWTERAVALELTAQTLGPDSRARLTWRSWSGSAASDDGVLEVEAVAARHGWAPVRLRLGAARLDRTPVDGYGVVGVTLARDERRSLGVHAVRRASSSVGGRASSTTLGARLDLLGGWFGRHSLQVEATRIRSGVSAWGVDLTPSGETTLRTRSRPGIWVSARGRFGARFCHFGYALGRGEDAGGATPWSGTMWLGLDRN